MDVAQLKKGISFAIVTLALLLCAGPVAHASVQPWMQAPVVPVIGPKDKKALKSTVAAGRELGMRAGVFAKVGDSNTDFAPNLYGLACNKIKVADRTLISARWRYNQVKVANPQALPGCRPWTSFSRRSVAARGGAYSTWSLNRIENLPDDGYLRKPPDCELAETPLGCEIRFTRPRFALVMLGSNDIVMDDYFDIQPGSRAFTRVGEVAKYLLGRGVVPVLFSIPPVINPEFPRVFEQGVVRTNAGLYRLSRTLRVPFVNLWRALAGPRTINRGLADDGLHLNVFGARGARVATDPGPTTFADSVNFTPEGLRYGANRRNLIWLKTLATLDRAVG